MKHKNIMVDIETMSRDSNACITSIGAVVMDFENHVLGDSFSINIDLISSADQGGHLDADTVLWWLKQSDIATSSMLKNTLPFSHALMEFQTWLGKFGPREYLRVWGNGATLDNVILENAYTKRMGWQCPWSYRGDMCYRTMKAMHPDIVPVEFERVAHNALDDAKYQALHLIQIMKGIVNHG